jgi:hypothetical protein
MSYNRADINKTIIDAVAELKKQQPMLFNKVNNIGERAVSTALSVLLTPKFPEYNVNCEYNRMTDEHGLQIPKRIQLNPYDEDPSRVYPDIIVHHQEDGEHNLLVVEIKMSWKNAEKNDDYKKLMACTRELRYSHGLYLELSEEGISQMSWFQNGKPI